jgi:hypothetical protein
MVINIISFFIGQNGNISQIVLCWSVALAVVTRHNDFLD